MTVTRLVLPVFAVLSLWAVTEAADAQARRLTQAFNPANPGGTQTHLWNGVNILDDLDELEVRNASGQSLARAVRDPSFAEP